MTIVLRNQFEASERSARELESQIPNDGTTTCHDVEDHLSSLVAIFGKLGQDVDRLQRNAVSISPNAGLLDEKEIELEDQYRRLEHLFASAARLVQGLKKGGFTVDGEESFNLTWRELRGMMSLSREQVIAGLRQIERGETRTLTEVMDELSDRPLD